MNGQSAVIGSPKPIVALAGDDVILPCRLKPAIRDFSDTVEWTREDLDPEFVHVHQGGRLVVQEQNPQYKNRTVLFVDELKNGNVSLKLFRVTISDEGRYRCFIPSIGRGDFIQLHVGAASSPVIIVSKSSSGVVLECESKGWYPEPELFWLDAEGKLLSAGAPETVRGPDGLYTVSSRVTVEKSHSNSFTCRVEQSKIQQTRQTQIHVSDDFFMDKCGCNALYITISFTVILVFMCILAAVFVVCKRRRNKIKSKKHEDETDQREDEEEEKIISLSRNTEYQDLIERVRDREQPEAERDKNAKLEEELQKKENKQKHWREECEKLKEEQREVTEQLRLQLKEAERQRDENKTREQQKEMENQTEELKMQLEEAERQRDENKRKLQETVKRKDAGGEKTTEHKKFLMETKRILMLSAAELEKQPQRTSYGTGKTASGLVLTSGRVQNQTAQREVLNEIQKLLSEIEAKLK
ncbi:butyrophilin subfamily 3 member A2-like [Myripristis murdjan]|uniref:butyrophilin subfamily 3 member A2-like n=1 Tax=Myripristis murdjan TaxID=586833 RepID=UPI0011763187|nr:butyrophilin subfamily 3 member A2-like [Myripristis murdjan]